MLAAAVAGMVAWASIFFFKSLCCLGSGFEVQGLRLFWAAGAKFSAFARISGHLVNKRSEEALG